MRQLAKPIKIPAQSSPSVKGVVDLSLFETTLRNRLMHELETQGLSLNPAKFSREACREAQTRARTEGLARAESFLTSFANKAQKVLRNGKDVEPEKISLRLELVGASGTRTSDLFRWFNLAWWSMPYQKPYGRQMRYLVWDEYHNALVGLIGLQSPILRQAVRDDALGIAQEDRDYWVNMSMSAQRVGAVPPYNQLLGGKAVSLALVSNELRQDYKNKYSHRETIMDKRILPADLLFTTTTSAFGRSSVYNRIKVDGHLVAEPLGYTAGYGSFHVPDNIFRMMLRYLEMKGVVTDRYFGSGPSRRMKLIDKATALLGLRDFHRHGIKREYFLFSQVKNLKKVIAREEEPVYHDYSYQDLAEHWRQRWCVPRASRVDTWKNFDKATFMSQIQAEVMSRHGK